MSVRRSEGANKRSHGRSNGSDPGGIVHAPTRATFGSPYGWLLAAVLYFLAAPVVAIAALASVKGWHGCLIAIALVTLWLWQVTASVLRAQRKFRDYRRIGKGKNFFMLRTLWRQRACFIDAGLSVPWPDEKREPRAPRIVTYGSHALGIVCQVEILPSQTPQMFMDSSDRLASAFNEELEVRRVDHRHVDIIFTILNPFEGFRIAEFGSSDPIFIDENDEDGHASSTDTDDQW
jgi:hypothetical protein